MQLPLIPSLPTSLSLWTFLESVTVSFVVVTSVLAHCMRARSGFAWRLKFEIPATKYRNRVTRVIDGCFLPPSVRRLPTPSRHCPVRFSKRLKTFLHGTYGKLQLVHWLSHILPQRIL